MMRLLIWTFLCFGLFQTCSKVEPTKQPNILWLTCEDISPLLSSYGDSTAKTPVLDKLAAESMVFTNVYATVGVCAPARSSIITGMYPASIGTMHMRTGKDISAWGARTYDGASDVVDINGDSIPLYSAVIPPDVKCFTEYLRANGYYCTNNAKTDYQFAAPVTAWDENSKMAHWKNTPKNMPFFSVFNHEITHESQIWKQKDCPLTVEPDSVPLPDYFPDNSVVRNDVARCYSNIELLDKEIGEKLMELEDAGLLDNTIIFFYSDHGGPLPRGKREHYESGLKVPFMIRFPQGANAGVYEELISFVDIAPTVLSLAGIEPPKYMQGQAFLGEYKSDIERSYVFASGDRFDEYADQSRSVTDGEFMYVRNFHPNLPRYKDVTYRKNMPMMNKLLQLNAEGALNEQQKRWFQQSKPVEEFYYCRLDPYQLNNLAGNRDYMDSVKLFSQILDSWQVEIDDKGSIPEAQLVSNMWPEGIQPETQKVNIKKEERLTLTCSTEGASIAYMVSDSVLDVNLDSSWKLYTQPITLQKEQILYSIACRIGYRDSEIITYSK